MNTNESAQVYRIWGTDNIAYGPVELPGLVNWIKEGRVAADSWVYADEHRIWRQARSIPELKMFYGDEYDTAARVAARTSANRAAGVNAAALRRIKVFADMDQLQLDSFLSYMEVIRVKKFSTIVLTGDHGDAMYLILEGEVRAYIMKEQHETTLSNIGVGDFFGEISLLDEGPRSASVVASEDSILLKISAESFEQLVREAPALAAPFLYALSRSVAGRIRNLTKRYLDSITFARAAEALKAHAK